MTTRSNTIAPGVIITLWRIIFLIFKLNKPKLTVSEVSKIILSKAYFGGTIPLKESIQVGIDNLLITIDKNEIMITKYALEEIVPLCDNDNPNKIALRKVLQKIILENRFYWVVFFNEDPEIFKVAVPEYWIILLDQVELFNFENQEVINWWIELFELLNHLDEQKQKAIGDVGELLTINYEVDRLKKEGFKKPNLFVKWVSRIGNDFGYDVSSIRGLFFQEHYSDKDNISIEVKSSVNPELNSFRFKVSKNEWRTARRSINSYYFYCWTGVNIESKTCQGGPYIISAEELIDHFPNDSSSLCQWSECVFILNLTEYLCPNC